MNVMQTARFVSTVATIAAALVLSLPAAAAAQQAEAKPVARLVVEPTALEITAGQTAPVTVTAYDAQGGVIAEPSLRVSGARNGLAISQTGVKGLRAGTYEIVVTSVSADSTVKPVSLTVPVTVKWPAIGRIELAADSGRLYTGVTLAHRARAIHPDSSERPGADVAFRWRSSNPAVASVDRYGYVTANRPGSVTITADAEGASAQVSHTVAANPVTSLSIQLAATSVRTGDVVHLKAAAQRANGSAVPDVPITWSYTYVPDDTIAAPGATGVIDRGLFAAEVPGRYTLLASAGTATARTVLEVSPREARRRINVSGRGSITHVHTSDFWPWTGKDGRDYALVGTWGGDGWADRKSVV